MDGRIEEVNGFLEMLASTQSLREKPAAERLVAILKEKLCGEPEKLRRLCGALNQVLLQICASDGDVVTVKQVPKAFLQRVEEILEGKDELILAFNSFLQVRNPKKPETIGQDFVVGFRDSVINCSEPVVLKPFSEILRLYKLGKKKNFDELYRPDLVEKIDKILSDSKAATQFGSYPDLICIDTKKSGEAVPIERKKRKDRDKEIESEGKGLKEEVLSFFGKVQERLSCSEKYITFLRNIDYYTNQKIDKAELVDAVSALIGQHSDLMTELNKYLKHRVIVDEQPRKARITDTKRCGERSRRQEMYLSKPIQELDLSKCEQCTPSYRLLPEDYPIRVASNRTKLGAHVLNDHWVCVPSEEFVYPSKERRRHRQEKLLVGLEDEIHELDMLVTRFTSATVYVKKFLEGGGEELSDWNIDMVEGKEIDFLSCVKKIYGEKGEEVIDALRNDSTRALPVVLIRLQQRLGEVKQCRSCFHKEWADLYAKE